MRNDCSGAGEVADRLSLYQHVVVNQVVAGVQMDHADIECAAPTYRLEQRRVPFRMVDRELMRRSSHGALPARWTLVASPARRR
jgi:hypothetical protein